MRALKLRPLILTIIIIVIIVLAIFSAKNKNKDTLTCDLESLQNESIETVIEVCNTEVLENKSTHSILEEEILAKKQEQSSLNNRNNEIRLFVLTKNNELQWKVDSWGLD